MDDRTRDAKIEKRLACHSVVRAFRSPLVPEPAAESRVVLDTNVFVGAAFNAGSASAAIVEDVRNGRVRLVWNDATRGETRAVLSRIPPISWERYEGLFRNVDRFDEPTHPERFQHVPDPPDREFAALAAAAGAVLVSSDEHLLGTREQGGVTVLGPSEFRRRKGD